MNQVDLIVTVAIGMVACLALLVSRHGVLPRARGGRVVAFFALFLLPGLALFGGFSTHMGRAQSTRFCLSCHVMTDYGRSLLVDSPGYLAAAHYQNNFVPRDRACYTCHSDYAMFGGVRAKLRGIRHMYVQYLGTIPPPGQVHLYEPFNNRECLHCHEGARRFEERSVHSRTPERMEQIKTNVLSCTSSRCHSSVHAVGTLADATFWKEGR